MRRCRVENVPVHVLRLSNLSYYPMDFQVQARVFWYVMYSLHLLEVKTRNRNHKAKRQERRKQEMQSTSIGYELCIDI